MFCRIRLKKKCVGYNFLTILLAENMITMIKAKETKEVRNFTLRCCSVVTKNAAHLIT